MTFHAPKDPRYDFKTFYERVKAKGFILYPGKLTQVETFRVGCIGHVIVSRGATEHLFISRGTARSYRIH